MSSPLAVFRRALATAAVEALGLPAELSADVERLIRTPEAGRGDLALPCFELARQAKKNPPEAAAQVRDAVAADPTWATAEAAGPYVNVTFAPPAIASVVVPEARSSDYGSSDAGAGQTITIDFSSPNIAKPLAFHHVRSTVIGAAIGRIHAKQGWTVAGINYLGDWGKQFGLLATGFARHGDPAKRADAKHLVEVYVKANAEADVDSVKKRINAPAEAQKAVAELLQVRGEVDRLEGKAKKKAAKRVKSLEKRLRGQRGVIGDGGSWNLEMSGKQGRVKLWMQAPPARSVCLGYENPDGTRQYCFNSKTARARLWLQPKGEPVIKRSSDTAALEFLSSEPDERYGPVI